MLGRFGSGSQLKVGKKVDSALKDLVVREDALLGSLDDDQRSVLATLLKIVVAPFDSS